MNKTIPAYIVLIKMDYRGEPCGTYPFCFRVIKETPGGYEFNPTDPEGNVIINHWQDKKSGITGRDKPGYRFNAPRQYYAAKSVVLCWSAGSALPPEAAEFTRLCEEMEKAREAHAEAATVADRGLKAEVEAEKDRHRDAMIALATRKEQLIAADTVAYWAAVEAVRNAITKETVE